MFEGIVLVVIFVTFMTVWIIRDNKKYHEDLAFRDRYIW